MTKDLVVLVPDKNAQFVLDGLLPRYQSFGIRQISYDIYIHPQHDPGVYRQAANFMAVFKNQYHYALVFLDREGSGQDYKSADQIAAEIKAELERKGWQNRAEVVVFDPELEIWAWVNSPHLATHLGWENLQTMESFIHGRGFWQHGSMKPDRPKEAIQTALREKKIQRSSAIYKKIATSVSFRSCQEQSFLRFERILIDWFAIGEEN